VLSRVRSRMEGWVKLAEREKRPLKMNEDAVLSWATWRRSGVLQLQGWWPSSIYPMESRERKKRAKVMHDSQAQFACWLDGQEGMNEGEPF
jgi:hypothetical protein